MFLFCSFWLAPPPLFSSLFCCGFVLPCCSCFSYIFIFPNIIFIFLILFYFVFSVIVLHLCFFSFLFFFASPHGFSDLGSQARGRAQAPVVGAPSPNCWTNREPQTPGNINRSEASWRSSSQHQDLAPPNCL